MPWVVLLLGCIAIVASPASSSIIYPAQHYAKNRQTEDRSYYGDFSYDLESGDDNLMTAGGYGEPFETLQSGQETRYGPDENMETDYDVTGLTIMKRALSALSRFKPLTSAFTRLRPVNDEARRDVRYAMRSYPKYRPLERASGGPLRYGKR